jgi:cholesterol oxidase
MLAVASPPPAGSFSYSAATGKVQLTWPATSPAVAAVTKAVKSTAGAIRKANPLLSLNVVTPALTSHSLGGCVLGQATGPDGEVIGHPGLFVVDSALIPGSCGSVPPALTVTALADRILSLALPKLSVS